MLSLLPSMPLFFISVCLKPPSYVSLSLNILSKVKLSPVPPNKSTILYLLPVFQPLLGCSVVFTCPSLGYIYIHLYAAFTFPSGLQVPWKGINVLSITVSLFSA